AESARLDELHAGVLEVRVDADLALGAHTALVPELEANVARYPLRERLREQLMLALYRAGRQAEALQTYRGARATLVEELGIEPGRKLQELEQAILRQDTSLDLGTTETRAGRRASGCLSTSRRRCAAHPPSITSSSSSTTCTTPTSRPCCCWTSWLANWRRCTSPLSGRTSRTERPLRSSPGWRIIRRTTASACRRCPSATSDASPHSPEQPARTRGRFTPRPAATRASSGSG